MVVEGIELMFLKIVSEVFFKCRRLEVDFMGFNVV